MRKVIAAINMTLDGYCDHTEAIADDELHQHYTDLLAEGGVLLYGRVTYQLMEDFWPALLKNPSGHKQLDDFAVAIDAIPKIVFSRTLTGLQWDSARLAERSLEEEVNILRQQPGKDIFVGSPGLIVALTNLQMIDEYQICVHPIVATKGLPLFNHIQQKMILQLKGTKSFGSGAIILYYSNSEN